MEDSYKLILFSGQVFMISSQARRLNDISNEIFEKLQSEKQYKVKSQVYQDTFLLFLKYLTDDQIPIITSSNKHDLLLLSEEFQVMKNIFYTKKIDYLNTIKLLRSETNNDNSQAEEFISEHLDEYLINVGIEIFSIPINSLYNIFFNSNRNLTQHNLCYNLIKQSYELNNNVSIFSLLPSLDGKLLSESNLNDSILSQAFRCGFCVKIEFAYILDLKTEFDEFKTNQEKINNTNEETINDLQSRIKDLEKQISILKQFTPDPQICQQGQIPVLNPQMNGYIWRTYPFSVYFEARINNISASYKLSSSQWDSIIPLDKIIVDTNNAFDVNLHAYRIPIKGKWLFVGHIEHHVNIRNGFFYISINKNGENLLENGLNNYNIAEWCLLLTCGVLECNKGDIIKLCVHHQTQFKKERTYLQGFYLSS